MKYLIVALILILIIASNGSKPEWIYEEQFPAGSENLTPPPIVLFSIYMGRIKYKHLPLLVSSMNHNPTTQFNIINIVEKVSDADDALQTIQTFSKFNNANNVHLEILTMAQFSALVKERLNIDVKFDLSWGYKMCDFKPTLAYLFPNLVKDINTYKYWGFADMDVVWGSFKKHASLFLAGEKIVISGWWHSTGAAVFSENEQWSRELFLKQSEKYVSLLTEKTYRNLDEMGLQINPNDVVDHGKWSMDNVQREYLQKAFKKNYKTGKIPEDHMFIDEGDSMDWAGVVLWHGGSLKAIKGSKFFPPGRQFLFYHSRGTVSNGWSWPSQPEFAGNEYFEDMVTYGYFLPSYTPLFSRFMCQPHEPGGFNTWKSDFHEYKPYDSRCFGKLEKYHYQFNSDRSSKMSNSSAASADQKL